MVRRRVGATAEAALIADMPRTNPATPLTTAELVSELQRLDPEGKRLVLLEPVAAPCSLTIGARPVLLWDGEECIALAGRL